MRAKKSAVRIFGFNCIVNSDESFERNSKRLFVKFNLSFSTKTKKCHINSEAGEARWSGSFLTPPPTRDANCLHCTSWQKAHMGRPHRASEGTSSVREGQRRRILKPLLGDGEHCRRWSVLSVGCSPEGSGQSTNANTKQTTSIDSVSSGPPCEYPRPFGSQGRALRPTL